ncbi:PRC-barrel domain-containing protein [Streptomyces sp. NPDC058434]|uniref:PRC-barrel domain-containing protein n=1 Tax=Streptomyces sp. NPDC058434 TaxID=3346498 RepID=UPI00365F7BD7
MTRDMWSYHPESHHRPGMRLTGYTVVATDGPIGTVDEATEELSSTYVVVDTGPWILGRHVLLPAGTIVRVDRDEEKLFVNRTRDEIKDAPAYDPDRDRGANQYRETVADYYRPFYS